MAFLHVTSIFQISQNASWESEALRTDPYHITSHHIEAASAFSRPMNSSIPHLIKQPTGSWKTHTSRTCHHLLPLPRDSPAQELCSGLYFFVVKLLPLEPWGERKGMNERTGEERSRRDEVPRISSVALHFLNCTVWADDDSIRSLAAHTEYWQSNILNKTNLIHILKNRIW